MKKRLRPFAVVLLLGAACLASQRGGGGGGSQGPSTLERQADGDVRLPNGKSQKDEILKAEHAQNLKDAQELVDISEQLRDSLEKNDRYVLSLADLKKVDDLEKLVKRIRSRLRRN
jgi:hypothetical protein